MAVPLLHGYVDWSCPNCPAGIRTALPAQTPLHRCPGLHDLIAPLIPAGMKAAVVAEERQDYLDGDTQATGNDGKAYMAVRTIREDGDDLIVHAGLAHAELRT